MSAGRQNDPISRRPVLVFLVTEDWYFVSHRLPMARAAQKAGYHVIVASRIRDHRDAIEAEGFEAVDMPLSRGSLNPFRELATVLRIVALYRSRRPDVVHHVAFKPTLYGAIAARLSGRRAVVNAMAGLGYVFISDRPLARIARPVVRRLFAWLFNRPGTVVLLQNDDDVAEFTRAGIAPAHRIRKVRGSGVDADRFAAVPPPPAEGPIVAAYVGRMIADKGVSTLVGAIRKVRETGLDIRLLLCGTGDPENPGSIDDATLHRWAEDPGVEWRGHVSDLVSLWSQSHIAVLASRREGLPLSLLEAAAAGRPIIASDVPGCREIAREGENALLFPFGDTDALAAALVRLAGDTDLRRRFGGASRALVRSDLSAEAVGQQIVKVYAEVLSETAPGETHS